MKKIQKLLIANRSEIALRIMRTAQPMGIPCVAIYSDSDASSLFVEQADEAYPLNADLPSQSYLDIEKIISIARKSNCDAIHPGYGFLAENASFAQACNEAGIIFVGPLAETIDLMGDKAKAKAFCKKNDIPVIPGEEEISQDIQAFRKEAEKIGYPVLLKASAGGGGKGMKLVQGSEDIESAYQSAKREALAAFGDDNLLIEKYFELARHVEVQILADQHGQVIHLIDRDCSLQRRHQKVVEEAPAYGISDECRSRMYECSIKLCKLINYHGAGTLEFLMDENENFYLMEMNTRLQVEHAVSEQITGVDIVRQQLIVAEGKTLELQQKNICANGHSIEVRIYAEQCGNEFLPSSGLINQFRFPKSNSQTRIDHALKNKAEITPLYDPMIAKLACWGETREQAIDGLSNALEKTWMDGPETNRGFVSACINHPAFRNNEVSTRFINQHLEQLLGKQALEADFLESISSIYAESVNAIQQSCYQHRDKNSPWAAALPFGETSNLILSEQSGEQYKLEINYQKNRNAPVLEVLEIDTGKSSLSALLIQNKEAIGLINFQLIKSADNLATLEISSIQGDYSFSFQKTLTGKERTVVEGNKRYQAPLNGRIIALHVAEGDVVEEGQELAVLEAMKMEHMVKARNHGTIRNLAISLDEQVHADQLMFNVEND